MEVAAMVTAINPAISSTADSLDIAVLQQVLSVVYHNIWTVAIVKSFLEIALMSLALTLDHIGFGRLGLSLPTPSLQFLMLVLTVTSTYVHMALNFCNTVRN